MLRFDREEKGAEEIMHFLDAHLSIRSQFASRVIRLILQHRLFLVREHEIAVLNRDQKVEAGEHEPAEEKAKQDQAQHQPPFRLHDEQDHVRVHILHLSHGRVVRIDATVLVDKPNSLRRRPLETLLVRGHRTILRSMTIAGSHGL